MNLKDNAGKVVRFVISVLVVIIVVIAVMNLYPKAVRLSCVDPYIAEDGREHKLAFFTISPATGSLGTCMYGAED